MKPLKSLFLTLIVFASVLSANAVSNATSKQASTATDAEITKAANLAGIDAAKLKLVSKRDKDLRIGKKTGAAFYACHRTASKIANPSDPESFTTATLFPFTKTFILHSRPGATTVIYLDFNGHVIKGALWNTEQIATTITVPAFDIDGKPATFNYAEHAMIQKIWKEVSDAFAAFDVDVTTQDPGVENIRKLDAGDTNYGVRVCFGGKSSYVPNFVQAGEDPDGTLGVTLLSCFDPSKMLPVHYPSKVAYANDNPVLIFSDSAYQRGSAKDVADTAVHELGHAFGLNHSTLSTIDPLTGQPIEYYTGHNDWAPYMGDTMGKTVGQWTNGDYDASATNSEDELLIISNYLNYMTDDHGGTKDTATTLSTTKTKSTERSTLPVYLYTSAATGLIHDRNDVDLFKIEVGEGEFYAEAIAADPQANLNIGLRLLYDPLNNGVLKEFLDDYGYPYSSEDGMNGYIYNVSLPAGTYYIEVDGVGAYWDENSATFFNEYIDPVSAAYNIPADCSYDSFTGTITNNQYQAFTDYASIGRYTLKTTSKGTPNNQLPTARTTGTTQLGGMAPSTVKFVGSNSSDDDGVITNYLWDFGDGTNSTLANPTHVYTTAGTYTATLLVTDNSNGTGSATTAPITVKAVSNVKAVNVLSVSVAWVKSTFTTGYFVATINVGDQNEKPVAGAVVSVTSSGLASGTATATTNAQGVVTIKSAVMPSTSTGTETFTVTNLVLSGYPYDSTKNKVSSGSLTR
jgi:PKD repeat protein